MVDVKIEKDEMLNIESLSYNGLTWVNIEKPTENETEYLAKNYPFHELDLDDTLSRRQRPKVDEYKEYLFFVLHFPRYKKDERVLSSSQVSVFISDNYIVTLHGGELKPLTKLFRECQITEESREQYFSHGSGFILYSIVDRLVDYCVPIINKMMDNIEEVEDDIFTEKGVDVIQEISGLRRDIISFRRIIWPMRAVIGGLGNRIKRFIDMDMTVYFGDLVDHADKIWDALDEGKEIIEGLSSTFDSMSTNKTNKVIRMLTVIATVMLPITVIASLYGMNIQMPFADSDFAILFVALIMIVVISSMLLLFRKIRII